MKIEFTIDNKNNTPSKVVLLGSNNYLLTKNFGSDNGIDIECLINDFQKLDYLQMLHQVMCQPSWIKSVMFESFYMKKKELNISYYHRDANGSVRRIDRQLIRNKWDDIAPSVFDGNTHIEFEIQPKAKIMFIVDDGKSQFAETKNNKRKLILK